MAAICIYFQVHQPLRIKKYRLFNIGHDHNYFNGEDNDNLNNKKVLQKVSRKSYLPTNALLLDLLRKNKKFKLSFSLTGIVLDQFEKWAPEVLDSFKKLIDTGRVEILSETYYHSLAFLYSKNEFKRQVELHKEKIKKIFGKEPEIFRNTELIYNNDLALEVEKIGYKGILAEGADHILGWRSPNFVYKAKYASKIRLLLKNYKLSDDIAFRFSAHWWKEYPLTADKYAKWLNQHNGNGEIINLFMDYETFGEHQWEDTGIFEFLRHLPEEILKHPDNYFITPSEAIKKFDVKDEIDVPHFISWADVERDLSAWLSNPIQHDAVSKIYDLEEEVLSLGNKLLIEDWRKLQTSDHFYYMCTKWFADGDVHKYFNPYDSPYDAYIAYMNVLKDIKLRIEKLKNSKE